MCARTVNYARQSCSIATESSAFEYDNSISAARTNLNQQIHMCEKWNHIRNHSLEYHLLFTVSAIPYCIYAYL